MKRKITMSRLKIDTEELIMALESHNDGSAFFLDLQSGELVRHHAYLPAGGVGRCEGIPVGEHLGRRLVLVARAEGTEPSRDLALLAREIHRALAALRRDDHPSADYGILAQLRHVITPLL